MVALCAPSSSASLMTVRLKTALVAPAGMFTLAGTVSSVVSLDESATLKFAARGPGSVTRPAPESTPWPSVTVAGAKTFSAPSETSAQFGSALKSSGTKSKFNFCT